MKLYKTGGGPCEFQSNILMERIRDIIKPSVEGIINTYDSDAIEEQSANVCNKKATKTNSCETLSDTTEMEEWLDDYNDQDLLQYLQQNNGDIKQDSFDNDAHEMTTYNKENDDIIDNESASDVNGNSPFFTNNKQHFLKKNNTQNRTKPEKQDVQKTSAVQILKQKISTPLQVKANVIDEQYKSRKLNRQDKPYKKNEDTVTSKKLQFDMLTESKIKLAECMTEDFKAKSEIEMQILSRRLRKEELEIQILEKELLLQEHRLQREVQQKNII
ncbi:uncharacterized protein LOC105840256 [Monomorium pharaonis]|uniref:uncharacterized protein LOC105840256 n=1 Tax=Monomorium pharaonis TaxID=307658 RepID=UPI00063EEBCF|nr:uncharacterized protein LOC105840256 [Monomorium pharaonis]